MNTSSTPQTNAAPGDASSPDRFGNVPPHVFQQAVEQAALAISITDAKADILYTNPAFRQVTGYATDEVRGRNESLLSYKVTPRIVYETLWAQLMRQRVWNGMLVNRRKDGSRYLADLTITPVVDAEGKTTHFLGMHRDVTDMHRLKRQVENQKALIESVVDAAPVAVVLFDENQQVILDNQEYKKLIGDLGREPAHTLLAAMGARMGAEFDRLRQSGRGFGSQEIRLDHPRRPPRWFSCTGTPVEEQDVSADAFYEPSRRRYLLLTIQEISALKRQEEEIRTAGLRALLTERDRIQSLRETMAGAVFQLEGPLNILAAALNMNGRRGAQGELTPLLATLEEALRSGRQALETMRACIPEEVDEPAQAVQLNAVLTDVLRVMTPELLAAGIVVEWSPAETLPEVGGRPRQLATLFRQLLANAIEAIQESRRQHRDIRMTTGLEGDHVVVLIEDSGPGIPPEWQLKAFEPFFTTKGANQQHIGMGLTMAQDIVARHGGVIEIDPETTEGCRVCVRLPCVRKEVT